MNNTQLKSQVVLKGITIELIITIFVYTSFYLLMNWDCHSQTMRGRFLEYGQLSFFIGIWFVHSCYCCFYKFIPDKKERVNYRFLVIPFLGIISIFLPEELLKDLDHDANHRAWISREYNTKTPVLAFNKKINIVNFRK